MLMVFVGIKNCVLTLTNYHFKSIKVILAPVINKTHVNSDSFLERGLKHTGIKANIEKQEDVVKEIHLNRKASHITLTASYNRVAPKISNVMNKH